MAEVKIPVVLDSDFFIKVIRGVTASLEFNETISDDYKKGFFDFADVLINTLEKISNSGTAEESRCDSCKGMTPKEAIRRIKNHNEVHSRKEKHFAVHITEALNTAVEALEKQIPKKAVKTKGEIVCPTCRTLVGSSPYCRYCGQALDWSDTE